MTDTEDALWARLHEAHAIERGPARSAALEAVVARADAAGFDELSLQGRMDLTESYEHGGEPAKAFATFSYCLGVYRRSPELFADGRDWSLRWQFKYMVNAMVKFPEVSLAQTRRFLTDMEAEYKVAGSTLHAVYANQHLVSRHIGDRTAAEDEFRRWTTTPRDTLSDCIGCDPESQVVWLAQSGRDADAVALADDVLTGRFTCIEQPHSILTELLLPYVRLGRLDDAVEAHRRAYRAVRHELTFLDKVGMHIEFCALTGNEARGLELLERHLPNLDRAPEPMAEMTFSASAALLLRRLTELGRGDLTLDVTLAENPETPTVRAWQELLARRALAVAARFDERNATSEQSDRIRALLGAEPLLTTLPLRTLPASTPRGVAASPTPVAPVAPVAAVDVPDDLDVLVERFVHGRLLDEPEADAVAAALADRVEQCRPDQLGHARLAAAMRAVDQSDPAAAVAYAEGARSAFDAVGDPVRSALATARLAQFRLEAGHEPGVVVEQARAAWESVAGSAADPALVASARHRAVQVFLRAGAHDDAAALIDLGVAGPDDLPGADPYTAAMDLGARAWWAIQHDDVEGAERLAASGGDLHRANGHPVRATRLALIQARCAAHQGRADEAVVVLDRALGVVTDTGLSAALLELRGQTHVDRGDLDAAADDLREAVTRHLLVGDRVSAAFAAFTLGWCELRRGRPLDAAEVLESSLPGYELAGEPVPIARTRRLLVDALAPLGETAELLRHADAAAETLREAEHWGELADLQSAAAWAVRDDRPDEATRLHASAVEAWDREGDPVAAARTRRLQARVQIAVDAEASAAAFEDARARLDALVGTEAAEHVDLQWERADCDAEQSTALWWIDRNEEAAPYAEAAEQAFVTCGAPVPAARSALLRARLVAERGETAAASTHLDRARALLPTDGDDDLLAWADRVRRDIDSLAESLTDDADGGA